MDFIPIVSIVLGLLLAFAGRRFLWLFIGVAGFVLGYTLSTFLLGADQGTVQLAVSVILGLVGAVVARRFTSFLLGVAGFVLVGSAVMALGPIFSLTNDWLLLALFLVGGLIGIGLVRFSFRVGVIVISALSGASLAAQGVADLLNNEPGALNLVLAAIIAVAGGIVQWRYFRDD